MRIFVFTMIAATAGVNILVRHYGTDAERQSLLVTAILVVALAILAREERK